VNAPRFIDICLTIMFVILAMVAVWQVQEFPFEDQLYPYTGSGIIIFFISIYVLRLIRESKSWKSEEVDPNHALSLQELSSLLPIAAAITLLIIGVFLLGHLITVPLFIFFYMLLRGEKWWVGLIGATVLFVFMWGLIINVMELAMPRPLIDDIFDLLDL